MQNETERDHRAVRAVAARETELSRFRDEFRALRVELRGREPEPEQPAFWSTDMFRPAPRVELPPINIVIHEREAPRTYDDPQPLVPRGVLVAGKIGLFFLTMAGIYYGPSYYSCRQMKEKGLFYFGTTVGPACRSSSPNAANPSR